MSAQLHEISIVSQSAYPQTSVQARAAAAGIESFGIYRRASAPLEPQLDYYRYRVDAEDGGELERLAENQGRENVVVSS